MYRSSPACNVKPNASKSERHYFTSCITFGGNCLPSFLEDTVSLWWAMTGVRPVRRVLLIDCSEHTFRSTFL